MRFANGAGTPCPWNCPPRWVARTGAPSRRNPKAREQRFLSDRFPGALGFSILELLVIIAVIAILAAIALPAYMDHSSPRARCKAGTRGGYAVVPLVFGSDRDVLRASPSHTEFGSGRGRLVYGTTEVSVPAAMQSESWRRPSGTVWSSWRIQASTSSSGMSRS
jgi:hypothetical protein